MDETLKRAISGAVYIRYGELCEGCSGGGEDAVDDHTQ